MLWLAFQVHVHDPEICLQHPSVHMGRKAIPQFLPEGNGIVDRDWISVCVAKQYMHWHHQLSHLCQQAGLVCWLQLLQPPPPPLYTLQVLTAVFWLAQRATCIWFFLAGDFQNLVHLLENYLLPWWYTGSTQSHRVEQRWRASLCSLGHEVPSIFALLPQKKYWTSSSFSAVKAGKAKISLKYIIWHHGTEAIIRAREEKPHSLY